MSLQADELTVTLHWFHGGQEVAAAAALSDSAPHDLVPVLVEGCELPAVDADGQQLSYELHLGAPERPPLQSTLALSMQGVRTGQHLWLVPLAIRAPGTARWLSRAPFQRRSDMLRCIIHLPDGTETVIPERGQALTRTWLLDVIKLHNPDEYARELKGDLSAYRFVSNRRAHCTLSRAPEGYWTVTTTRGDVETDLNGTVLSPNIAEPLNDGDELRLGGPDGVVLRIVVI